MLTGKVAVVTGASRGIGKAIALKFASQGAMVVINYNGSKDRAEGVKNEIEAAGGKAVIYQCDVSDYEKCETFIQNVIKEYGSLDILINNAGITKDGLLMKMSEEDFDKVIETNLKGTFNTIRFATRQMLKQRNRANHQHVLCSGCYWKCRSGELCGFQSGSDRTYKSR